MERDKDVKPSSAIGTGSGFLGRQKTWYDRSRSTRSINDRLHDGRLEIAQNHACGGCLDEQDGDELLLGVDPEMGAECAVPTKAAVRRVRPNFLANSTRWP